jgi:hypothetical protein
MNAAHGVITALILNDRYVNTNYGTSAYNWAADTSTYTNSAIYNKIDVRSDGDIWNKSSYRAPSVETYGTHGHTMNMNMYGDNPGALYCNMYKKLNKINSRELIPFSLDMATSSNLQGFGCSADAYLYNYNNGYLIGSRSDNLGQQAVGLGSGNWSKSWTQANSPTGSSGLYIGAFEHITVGYRGFTRYPGYNSRIGQLRIRPYYMRLRATSGYA